MTILGLEGKTAVVTGGGQGIGRGVALAFARSGCRVVVVDSQLASAEAVVTEIEALGGGAVAVEADLRSRSAAAAAFDAAGDRVDVLVNNVGGLAGHDPTPVLDATDEFWDAIVELNLRVTFVCAQLAARRMVAQGTGGSIINISALGGLRASVGLAPYGAAKAAVDQLTRTLAQELGPHGIRVNCIAPGRTETPAMLAHVTEADRAATAANIALRRLATPDDIGGIAVALASDLCGYVTGQTIAADGGLSATMARPPVR